MDYEKGIVTLDNFRPLSYINNTHIKINIPLQNKNVFASRARILTIDTIDPDAIKLTIRDLTER